MGASDQEINVALTADFSNLAAGMTTAADLVGKGSADMSGSLEAGMAASAAAVQNATASITRSVSAQIADIQALDGVMKGNIKTVAELAAAEGVLDRLQKDNLISTSELASAFRILEKAESAVARESVLAAGGIATVDKALKSTAHSSTGVTREMGVMTGEAMRGNWTRLEGSAIVLANRANLLQYAFSPLGLTIAAVTAAMGAMVVSFEQASNREQEFTRLTEETGGALDLTRGEFDSMAQNMAHGSTSIGEAEKVITKLGESGHISGDQLGVAGQAAIDMSLVTGKSMDECVDAINKLAKDPVKSIETLNESYNFLTAAQLDEINKLDQQGDHMGASTRAMQIYAEAMKQRADEIAAKTDYLSKKWDDLRDAATKAWRAMGDGLRAAIEGQNETDKINALNDKINELKGTWKGLNDAKVAATDQGGPAKELRALEAQRDALINQGKERTRLAAQHAQEQRAAADAEASQIAFNKQLSDGINLQDKITEAKKRAEAIHKADPTADSIKGIKFDDHGAVAGGEQWDATVKKLTATYDKVGVAADKAGVRAAHAADAAAKATARAAHKAAMDAAHAANAQITLDEKLGTERAKEIKKEEKERHDADLAELNGAKDVADAKRSADRQELQEALSSKRMSAAQVLAEQKRLDAEQYAADVEYYKKKAQLDKGDVKEVIADTKAIEKAREDYRKADLKAETEYQKQLQKQWQQTSKTIERSIGGALKGMIVQGRSFKQTMFGLLGDTATWAIDKGLETLFSHQAVETGKTGASIAGNAARTASDVASTQTSMALTSQKGIQSIMTSGAEVIGRVWSSIAAIPYVGPFLAPAMAIAAGAAVYKLAGSIPSASGGWGQVPGDTLAQIHKDEMVLPADLAHGVRNMANMKGGNRGGGDTYHIHATDAKSFADQMRRNPAGIAKGVKRAKNRGHLNGVVR